MPVSEAKPGSVDKEWAAHAADDAAAFANVLSKYVDQVVNAGLLHEKIRTLELVHQGQSRRWDVTAKGNDSTTEAEWSCYGWGLPDREQHARERGLADRAHTARREIAEAMVASVTDLVA
ncbi:MAG: hypothetical protein LQ338_001811 [Usnochroma carphineum]|nr:MAG: hypothetical protein LQ338_001811 [Usnochroma carphineum]